MPLASIRRRLRAAALALTLLAAGAAEASGPRYVAGTPYFTATPGTPVVWRQTALSIFTDPGDLSASVDHAAADALVLRAASAWNVPVARLSLSLGGTLGEHVSGENVYLGDAGLVVPADVAVGNGAAVPIAVIYDTDGSVTDTLLGAGASDPSGCRQAGVTESVDGFDPAGYITHALVIVNGRCSGAAPEMQLQLQYQMERAFGRVLGLAWSQTNDNVFTGSPVPTAEQARHWPIMHPVDIVCGLYTYQCLPSPFSLRPDDVAGLVGLYPIRPSDPPAPGKQPSLSAASVLGGSFHFPTGQGMTGVNVLLRRHDPSSPASEGFIEASAQTGTGSRRNGVAPFAPPDTTPSGSFGTLDPARLGDYKFPFIPIDAAAGYEVLELTTEAVNPLYTGAYSVGIYAQGIAAPSGSPKPLNTALGPGQIGELDEVVADAAPNCGDGTDGDPAAPAGLPTGGWWHALLCPYGHTSNFNFPVIGGRSGTVEITALDENGFASEGKAMPLLALYAGTDSTGSAPSLGWTPAAFNGLGLGTTTLPFVTGAGGTLRLEVADARADGRPDFALQGRVLLAGTLAPAELPAPGGTVTLTGMGFRVGNAVRINGVQVTVQTATESTLVISVPAAAALGAQAGTPVDVEVDDRTTGASTIMTGALLFSSGPGTGDVPDTLQLIAAPTGSPLAGDPAPTPYTVRLLGPDGMTPVAGASVVLSVPAGAARFAACAQATCTLVTDATGTVSSGVTPIAGGPIVLKASTGTLSVSAKFTAEAQAGDMGILQKPTGNVDVGTQAPSPLIVLVVDGYGRNLPGRLLRFSVIQGQALLSVCNASTCTLTTDGSGTARLFITPTGPGLITVQISDGDLSKQMSITGVAHQNRLIVLSAPSGANTFPYQSAGVFSVRLLHDDGSGAWLSPIDFTPPPGVRFNSCGPGVCTIAADPGGGASTAVIPSEPGTFTVTASSGSGPSALVASATFTVLAPSLHLRFVSVPPNNSPVGQPTTVPLSAQLLNFDGTPLAGVFITLSAPYEQLVLDACWNDSCVLTTDAQGMVSTPVTPLQAGQMNITAIALPLVVSANFSALTSAETMHVVNAPPLVGSYTGVPVPFGVQILGTDGVSPVVGRPITFSVTGGAVALACGAPTCTVLTNGDGIAKIMGTPTQPSTPWHTWVQAADGPITQTIMFAVLLHPDVLQLLSAPADHVAVGSAAQIPLSVQVFAADGVTPGAGAHVTLSIAAGSAQFGACPLTPCLVQADARGVVSVLVTPLAPGSITLEAAEGGSSVTATFLADPPAGGAPQPDTLALLSAPASGGVIGRAAPAPFAVHAAQPSPGGGGAPPSPAAGHAITFSVRGGSATLAACAGASSCTVLTDASGNAQTAVTPQGGLAITLVATLAAVDGGASVSATFTPAAPVEHLTLVSAPSGEVTTGAPATTPFAARILLDDGVTPVPGRAVQLSAAGGAIAFAACGGASGCTLTTGSDGLVSSAVTPVLPGPVTLQAASSAGDVKAAFLAVPPAPPAKNLLVALTPQRFVAAGVASSFSLGVAASTNGLPAAARAVTWSAGNPAITFGQRLTSTDASGSASDVVTLAPLTLPPGSGGSLNLPVTACAWTAVCANFTLTVVAPGAWTIAVVAGADEAVSGGAAPPPVQALVTDGSGHPISGASVAVYQTVTAAADGGSCPARGRCPAAPVLQSRVTAVSTDAQGLVTVVPLTVPGVATETELAFSTGANGFATTVVSSLP